MATATYDKTPVSPTDEIYLGSIGYRAISNRPVQPQCNFIEECPDCDGDSPFKYPVANEDEIYLQFRIPDNYNQYPTEPTAGWYEGDPSGEYWLTATMEFEGGHEAVLPTDDIVLSATVGYFNGSYQNLILDVDKIQAYINDNELGTRCFRLRINYCRRIAGSFTFIYSIKPTAPTQPDPWWPEGAFVVIGAALYQLTNGVLVYSRLLVANEILFNVANGLYYQYNGGSSFSIVDRPESTVNCESTCYTAWFKIVRCEDTILLNGIHGESDCLGNYYGGQPPHQDLWRIEASFEMQSITTEKTTNENDVVTELRQYENWLLRNISSLPDDVIRRLANTLQAQKLFVDAVEYINPGDVTKSNESGLYWYTSVEMQRFVCEKLTDCDVSFEVNPYVPPTDCEPCPDCPECPPACECTEFDLDVYIDGELEASETLEICTDYTINLIWE